MSVAPERSRYSLVVPVYRNEESIPELLRAMAWTMHESFDPFKPLVTLHLER